MHSPSSHGQQEQAQGVLTTVTAIDSTRTRSESGVVAGVARRARRASTSPSCRR
ncbi:hypothetical protein ACFQ0B_57300 [Nonomuraea thailandensis]